MVIPIYRAGLEPREEQRLKVSLAASNCDSFFVGPVGLDRAYYREKWPEVRHEEFDAFDFATRKSYNSWMMKSDLYDRFRNYRFILVCQTDAILIRPFPFSFLCDFRFDYVGAPWIPGWSVSWNPFTFQVNSEASRWTKRWIRVGNGGLSLRRVNTFRWATKLLPPIKNQENEDKVFSYFAPLLGVRIPPAEVAEKIFMEQGALSFSEGDEIPPVYGFHALEKFNKKLEDAVIHHARPRLGD